jgi:hypothetical protein
MSPPSVKTTQVPLYFLPLDNEIIVRPRRRREEIELSGVSDYD